MQFIFLSADTLIGETIITNLTLKHGLASPNLQEKILALHSTNWNGLEEATSLEQRGAEAPHSYAKKHRAGYGEAGLE